MWPPVSHAGADAHIGPPPGGDKPRSYDLPIHPSPVGAALVAARLPRRGRCPSARSGRRQAPPLHPSIRPSPVGAAPVAARVSRKGRCPHWPASGRGQAPPLHPSIRPSPVGAALVAAPVPRRSRCPHRPAPASLWAFRSAYMALFSILFVFYPSYITIWS